MPSCKFADPCPGGLVTQVLYALGSGDTWDDITGFHNGRAAVCRDQNTPEAGTAPQLGAVPMVRRKLLRSGQTGRPTDATDGRFQANVADMA
jgi:hypothetical protein